MAKLKREYSIALTAIIGVVLLVFGVNYLKGLDLLQKRNVYHVVYKDVSGVVDATPLFYNGYKVGQVVHTEMLSDGSGRICVSFQVNEERLVIPSDSRIQLFNADFFSRAAQIVLGQSPVPAEKGDTLKGGSELGLMGTVNEQIDPLKRKAEGMIASVDSLLNSMQMILNTEAIGDINASFGSIRRTLGTLEQTSARLDAVMSHQADTIEATIRNLHTLSSSFARNSSTMDRIFANLDTASAALAKADLEKLLADLGATSAQLKETLAKINDGTGTMGKLVNNDSLYNNLTAASAELDLLLEDLRVNPNRYLSIFGKKDRTPKLSDADVRRIRDAMMNKEGR